MGEGKYLIDMEHSQKQQLLKPDVTWGQGRIRLHIESLYDWDVHLSSSEMLILCLFPSHESGCQYDRAHFTSSFLLCPYCSSYVTAEIFPAWRYRGSIAASNPAFNWLQVSPLSDTIFLPREMKAENSTKKLIQLSQHLNPVILLQQLEKLALLQNRTNLEFHLFTSFHPLALLGSTMIVTCRLCEFY